MSALQDFEVVKKRWVVHCSTTMRVTHNIELAHLKKEDKHFGSFTAHWFGTLMIFRTTRGYKNGWYIGLGGLCWHNFGHNRYQKALSIMWNRYWHDICSRLVVSSPKSRPQTVSQSQTVKYLVPMPGCPGQRSSHDS